MSEVIQKYDAFLDSECPWTHFACNQCGYWSTHPLNYCPECPGKIFTCKPTWLQHIKLAKKKYHLINMCLSQAGLTIEYPSDDYDYLFGHLKARLNK